MSAPTVAARRLVKRFGRTVALRGVDLELAAGASLAVLGANGAGKSTLLRMIAGLARPTAGTLEVSGHPATSREARRCIGYVGHETFLYPSLTARENLRFAARLYGLPDGAERADAALAREGLADVAERRAGGFSRGMAQRLSIARGLIHDPALVLLDEPYTGLDGRSARRLDARIDGLRAEGRTLVWVTHEPARAARSSDRAVVLARGAIRLDAAGAGLRADVLEDALEAGAAA